MSRSYEIKLNRAEQHLTDVRKCVSDYVARKPYFITKEEEPEKFRRMWSITLTEPIPPDVPPTVGDCIHNLRSALDHWVSEFSVPEGGHPRKDTSFPILDDETNWNIGPCGTRDQSGADRVHRLPDAVKAVIKAYQAFDTSYTAPAFHRTALRRLHELDIWDKHQALNVLSANMDVIGWPVPEGTSGDTKALVFPNLLELHTPKPMLLVEFPNRHDFDVSVNPNADLKVILVDEKADWWPPTELLVTLDGFVRAVTWAFRLMDFARVEGKSPFLPSEPSLK